MSLVEEVKKKQEFSDLPDSIVKKALEKENNDVKDARALLRKYFGVFLTNKVRKGKLSAEEVLSSHMSSMNRNYDEFYKKIFDGIKETHSVVDFGCGANGFSYKYLKDEIGSVDYVGVEAAGQLVDQMNEYFEDKLYLARIVHEDLFDIDKMKKILSKQNKNRAVFMFQVVDALENLEKNFSKKFIEEISSECELIVVSVPMKSLGGKIKFAVKRKWLTDFFKEKFEIKKDFELDGERIFVLEKKS